MDDSRTPYRGGVAEDSTHSIPTIKVNVQGLPSLFGWDNSFKRTVQFVWQFFLVLLSPCLRDPAAFVNKPSNKDHVGRYNLAIQTKTTSITSARTFVLFMKLFFPTLSLLEEDPVVEEVLTDEFQTERMLWLAEKATHRKKKTRR